MLIGLRSLDAPRVFIFGGVSFGTPTRANGLHMINL
jgi:hypothetical protein